MDAREQNMQRWRNEVDGEDIDLDSVSKALDKRRLKNVLEYVTDETTFTIFMYFGNIISLVIVMLFYYGLVIILVVAILI